MMTSEVIANVERLRDYAVDGTVYLLLEGLLRELYEIEEVVR